MARAPPKHKPRTSTQTRFGFRVPHSPACYRLPEQCHVAVAFKKMVLVLLKKQTIWPTEDQDAHAHANAAVANAYAHTQYLAVEYAYKWDR